MADRQGNEIRIPQRLMRMAELVDLERADALERANCWV